ncbi:hypothetical protein [Hansschlegelia plantiphila]|uniref:Uncharacterized protein n=1 Tax=Hansschlegelia plantiphila TaxID=374655 RepID=A0A9W6J164_9HYPH|nr:hypothetical protein [Hansschlegelia plantiphila]GLK67818.1 hypothetical protein GCM10008179_14560 [Hansschlegelia plantiphila]
MTFRPIIAALIGLAGLGSAQAADIVYGTYPSRTTVHSFRDLAYSRPPYTGNLPSCADAGIHNSIIASFGRREREYWHSGLQLSTFVQPVELGYRSWGRSFIPRRFCSATAVTTDGVRREVYWHVAERLGGALTTGVDWCVSGLDRNYAYAPDCKMARP